jgi:Fe-S-cluster containining protein
MVPPENHKFRELIWMPSWLAEYKNDFLCETCGGKCCLVYGPHENLKWRLLHGDPSHLNGGGYYRDYGVEPLKKKIDPQACEYLSPTGCIIPWEKRPPICKNYRCGQWLDLLYRRY